ncbi:hypothetical protein M2404_000427 [Rheinheimera pacifica]|nr:hypothetical protein [Rheinheimera pacifica]
MLYLESVGMGHHIWRKMLKLSYFLLAGQSAAGAALQF